MERTPGTGRRRVGVVASFDFTRQAEAARWLPPELEWSLTLTDEVPYRDNAELARRLSDPALLAAPARRLVAAGAEAVAYLCAVGGFARGPAGEAAVVAALHGAGAARAVTTTGAVTAALRRLGARRIAVVHPYQEPVGDWLRAYLAAAGFEVVSLTPLGAASVEAVYGATQAQVVAAVRAGDRPEADAVFVSCSALPTYEVVGPLEELLGKPVVTANQATMWALAGQVGVRAVGGGRLLEPAAPGAAQQGGVTSR
ncbi:Asp/Glu racemase [Streptomyces sp. NPDC059740]|uniref:maleate cis-trans isomerase family protein n=1 Tax=Streptomyces sp. NPDC059740 TaxID=3346926 RepID=UPI0036665DF7